uniref:Exonuclease domain-containing protein n=1 Tax=Panagrellus redivivus TaxID=6233 RepID=A0A7E4UXS8_PANRE
MTLPPEYDPVSWAPSSRDGMPQSSYGHHTSPYTPHGDTYMVSLSGSLIDWNATQAEITSIAFDPRHDILWTGNGTGRVKGFSKSNDQLTSFFEFWESKSPILQIDAYDEALAVVTADTFSVYNREGQNYYRHQAPEFEHLRCVHRPTPHKTKVFIGGLQGNVSLFDLEAQRLIRSVVDDSTGVTMMRSNNSNLICANDRGNITIRSHSGDKISDIQAHQGPITGFDVCGNFLLTAGSTITPTRSNQFGTPQADLFVHLFDLRNMSASHPLQTPVPTQHVFFGDPHGTVIMTSHFGHLWSANLNHTWAPQNIQVMPNGTRFNHLALSSNRQCIATVDSNQFARFYLPYNGGFQGSGFNYRSQRLPTRYTYSSPVIPEWQRNNRNRHQAPVRQYHHAPSMPMHIAGPSSDVADVSERMGAMSFDPSNGGRMNNNDHRNGTVDKAITNAARAGSEMSQKIYAEGFFLDVRTLSRSLATPEWLRAINTMTIPRLYTRPVDKDRHDKAIFERFNVSQQVPLLMNADAPIVNSFIRAIAAVPPVKKLILSHLCRRRNCILCELQFIVRNIHAQEINECITPLTCNAIIREMAAYADFAPIKDLTPCQFSGLAVSLFTNFFFHHIFQESTLAYDGNAHEDLHLNKTMEVNYQKSSTCSCCGSVVLSHESRHVITLKYPYDGRPGRHVPFVQLLEESFDDTTVVDGGLQPVNQCNRCFRMAPRHNSSIATLPSVLVVDTAINRPGYYFWNTNADIANNRPNDSLTSYDLRFVREGSPQNQPTNFHERTVRGVSDAVHSGVRFSHYVPAMFSAEFSASGKVCFSPSIGKKDNNKVYALCSAVMSIADSRDSEHYISICKSYNHHSPVLNFTVFNDYIVTPVKVDEALYTHSAWKMPHLLFFCDVEMLNLEITPVSIPRAVFDDERPENGEHPRVPPPPAGEIVALDSEFVQNESKEHVLGRISCLNKDGEPIIDDYSLLGCNEQIGDYLTPFSGIVSEDLNPATSTKYLLSRKKSYLKVLYLVENQNIFVGHALHNDFRILNIYIPADQIIDTCLLYRLEGKQCLSLRGLVDHVFGESIQTTQHDSVEDAMSALRLYKKYKTQTEEKANITSWLRDIYDETQKRSCQEPIVAPRNSSTSAFATYLYTPNRSSPS